MRRSQSRVRVALVACIGTFVASLGCSEPQTCDARGASTEVTGIVSYVRGTDAGSTFSGSIDVFDYSQSCTYETEEFPVSVGGCTLWANLQQGAEPPISYHGTTVFPGSSDGWADIEPGQVCDLPTGGGVTTLTVTAGGVDFAESTTTLLLLGTVGSQSASNGGGGGDAGASDAFQWQFIGNGVPP